MTKLRTTSGFVQFFSTGWCLHQPERSANEYSYLLYRQMSHLYRLVSPPTGIIAYFYCMNIQHKRQGQMDTAICYFYTDTVYEFKHLLKDDALKIVCINSWKYLVEKQLIKIYGYVIMPNHIHLLWKMLDANGKESPAGSFAKFTAHQFKKILTVSDPLALQEYSSSKADRVYQFWKRDPLAIPITSEKNLIQKLDYIHNNPVQEKWRLADLPEHYRWSSAGFYMGKPDEFGILTHYAE